MRLHWRAGTAAMAPHAALAEIGVPYELAQVQKDAGGRVPAVYLALNPSGLVPTLEDGDLVLTEAAAILLHLADRFPDAGLLPALGTNERSEAYRWLIHLTNTVQPTLMRVIYPERFGTAGVRDAAMADADAHFAAIDRHLTGREWLVGRRRTAADLLLFTVTRFARHLDPPAWSLPHVGAHVHRCLALPGVARMLREQGLQAPVPG